MQSQNEFWVLPWIEFNIWLSVIIGYIGLLVGQFPRIGLATGDWMVKFSKIGQLAYSQEQAKEGWNLGRLRNL